MSTNKSLPVQTTKKIGISKILLSAYLLIFIALILPNSFIDDSFMFSYGGVTLDYNGYLSLTSELFVILSLFNIVFFPAYLQTKNRDPFNKIISWTVISITAGAFLFNVLAIAGYMSSSHF